MTKFTVQHTNKQSGNALQRQLVGQENKDKTLNKTAVSLQE